MSINHLRNLVATQRESWPSLAERHVSTTSLKQRCGCGGTIGRVRNNKNRRTVWWHCTSGMRSEEHKFGLNDEEWEDNTYELVLYEWLEKWLEEIHAEK